MNAFGHRLRLTLFGESHGPGVGAVLDGVPPGTLVDLERMRRDLALRRPGGPLASARQESDQPTVLSGVQAGRATGAPLALWIPNEDARSADYTQAGRLPRPGHADWTERTWSQGFADLRGGGHQSGRLTAPLVAAGSVAQAILDEHGIAAAAHLHEVEGVAGPPHAHGAADMDRRMRASPLRTAHTGIEQEFRTRIETARRELDSVGGAIEFVAEGLPVGLGDPHLDGLEPHLAHLLFAIPAVKGVEFGEGFHAAAMRGSAHNDPFELHEGQVRPATNHAGGSLGGRATGLPLRGKVAVKPTSTLPGRAQATVDLGTMRPASLTATGRHDPCIALRAVPVVQAAVRLALADLALLARQQGLLKVPERRDP